MPLNRKHRAPAIALISLAAAALLGIAAIGGMALILGPSGTIPPAGALFTVERGEGSQSVGQRLRQSGLMRSALAFRLLGRIEGSGPGLKAGTYRIEPGMGVPAILDLLKSGHQALVRITVPEGFTLGQTARLLDRQGIVKKEDFVAACHDPGLINELGIGAASLEGYLFPDTYYFAPSTQGVDAARSMVAISDGALLPSPRLPP